MKLTNKLRAEWLLLPGSIVTYYCPNDEWLVSEIGGSFTFSARRRTAAIDKAVRHWLKTRRAGK